MRADKLGRHRLDASAADARSRCLRKNVTGLDLYGVATKVLLQAVKRNNERFPEDFVLRLTVQEWEFLRRRMGSK